MFLSPIITSPSIVKFLIGFGSISIIIVQLPFIVTLSPDLGRTPPGHCVELLQFLINVYFVKILPGIGHKYRHVTPLTSI